MIINENDSRVRRTKKLIKKGLMELSETKSVDKISVKELTEYIDINRGTFYLHYSDIDDLTKHLQDEIYTGFDNILSTVTAEKIINDPVDILYDVCVFLHDNADICRVFLNTQKAPEFANKISDFLIQWCRETFSKTYPNLTEEKCDLICQYFKYGGMGLTRSWLSSYPERTPREIAELWFSIARGGVLGILESSSKAASEQ